MNPNALYLPTNSFRLVTIRINYEVPNYLKCGLFTNVGILILFWLNVSINSYSKIVPFRGFENNYILLNN